MRISPDAIQEAHEQSQQMAVKLKQIRAILGYQNQTARNSQPKINVSESRKEEKGASIKNFVVLMRKKRESGLIDYNRPEVIKMQGKGDAEDHAIR